MLPLDNIKQSTLCWDAFIMKIGASWWNFQVNKRQGFFSVRQGDLNFNCLVLTNSSRVDINLRPLFLSMFAPVPTKQLQSNVQ